MSARGASRAARAGHGRGPIGLRARATRPGVPAERTGACAGRRARCTPAGQRTGAPHLFGSCGIRGLTRRWPNVGSLK
eukprot:2424169-Prymnesium_polylepis.1